jgi:peroxiredoxin Q/BCP
MPAKKKKNIIPEGAKAPDFTLLNENNESVSLSDYQGQWLVLYAYPRDLTPGCTTEAIDFSALKDQFKQAGAAILGWSADTPEKHCSFIEKKELSINLLSDTDHKVLEQYGAWQLKKFMGKEFMGIVRSTWLINPEGLVIRSWEKVKVKGHAQEVLETLKEAQK